MNTEITDENRILKLVSNQREFQITDPKGNELAEEFERPLTSCYVHSYVPVTEKGQILAGFGRYTETLEEGIKMVKDLFLKYGFIMQE